MNSPAPQSLIEAIYAKAGLDYESQTGQMELLLKTAAGGAIWESGKPYNKTHEVCLQFEAGSLPGDVEIFLVPIVTGQFFRRVTVNRQFSQSYMDTGMSQARFIEATAERLADLVLEQGFLYCENDTCTALTHESSGKCRVCSAPLQEGDEEPDEGEEDEAAEPGEPTVPDIKVSTVAPSAPTTPPAGPPTAPGGTV